MKGVRLVGINRLPPGLPSVEKSCDFPIHAVRVKWGVARLFYFYLPEINTAVCTNCIPPGDDIPSGYAIAEQLRRHFLESASQPLNFT